ncbi:MAG: peptide ABC transporter substrate-binding protein, partial [Candidatus Rokubacteria bacterium]|nr:peptide ABC transporter substrate-binding protein [Candidatus Rokubacteria bacterium]
MAAQVKRHPMRFTVVALLVLSALAPIPAVGQSKDAPRRGGVLLAVIGAEPPSLDPHQDIQLVAPFYSLLMQFDPLNFPKIIGDLATEWKISPDGLTYTFKIHQGIRFHDGSTLTAADVKASYDKIIFPP